MAFTTQYKNRNEKNPKPHAKLKPKLQFFLQNQTENWRKVTTTTTTTTITVTVTITITITTTTANNNNKNNALTFV